jgi:hypothetical protein
VVLAVAALAHLVQQAEPLVKEMPGAMQQRMAVVVVEALGLQGPMQFLDLVAMGVLVFAPPLLVPVCFMLAEAAVVAPVPVWAGWEAVVMATAAKEGYLDKAQ